MLISSEETYSQYLLCLHHRLQKSADICLAKKSAFCCQILRKAEKHGTGIVEVLFASIVRHFRIRYASYRMNNSFKMESN